MVAEARLKSKNLYYVREGKLPRGKHEIGFKELSWNKKTLDEFIRRSKHEK